jgi:hypothetical protein
MTTPDVLEPHSPPGVVLLATVDVEEDCWDRSREHLHSSNDRKLPRLQRMLEDLGARPTYFVSYAAAMDEGAAAVLREIAGSGGVEIGAHLHPWNTPPLMEPFTDRNSMLSNLPGDLQESKIERLGTALEERLEVRPRAFRAGRLGLGPETVAGLLRLGYRIDSSVQPFADLRALHGPDFDGAPVHPYFLDGSGDVRVPVDGAPLLEIPLTAGFTRAPFGRWSRVHRALSGPLGRGLRAPGLASRSGLVRKVSLTPELERVDDMLLLSRRLIDQGVVYLTMAWHSVTMAPGLGPYTRTEADVDRFLAKIERYVDRLAGITGVAFATIGEAAARIRTTSPNPACR